MVVTLGTGLLGTEGDPGQACHCSLWTSLGARVLSRPSEDFEGMERGEYGDCC